MLMQLTSFINKIFKPKPVDKIIIAFTFKDMYCNNNSNEQRGRLKQKKFIYVPNREGIHIEKISVDNKSNKEFFTKKYSLKFGETQFEETLYTFRQEKINAFTKIINSRIEGKIGYKISSKKIKKVQFLLDGHGFKNNTIIHNENNHKFNELSIAPLIGNIIDKTKAKNKDIKYELKFIQCYPGYSKDIDSFTTQVKKINEEEVNNGFKIDAKKITQKSRKLYLDKNASLNTNKRISELSVIEKMVRKIGVDKIDKVKGASHQAVSFNHIININQRTTRVEAVPEPSNSVLLVYNSFKNELNSKTSSTTKNENGNSKALSR